MIGKISILLIIPQIPIVFNEIAQDAVKSSLCSDEICYADEIKSVLISRRSRISSIVDGFIPDERTDLVEKKHPLSTDKGCFFSAKERLKVV